MDFMFDNRIVVIDNKNMTLHVKGEHLQTLGSYKFNNFRHAVSVISNEEVAVTTGAGRVVEILHISKTDYVTLRRKIKTESLYFSVCLMDDSNLLLNTFSEERPMRMVSIYGDETDLKNLPKKCFKREESMCTFIHHTHMLVLTDKKANSVHMFEHKSNMKEHVVKHKAIKEPRGVCAGPEGTVFVCCKGTDKLVQISPSGRVLGSHKLKMRSPFSVCISKDRSKIAVSNSYDGRKELHIYSVN